MTGSRFPFSKYRTAGAPQLLSPSLFPGFVKTPEIKASFYQK